MRMERRERPFPGRKRPPWSCHSLVTEVWHRRPGRGDPGNTGLSPSHCSAEVTPSRSVDCPGPFRSVVLPIHEAAPITELRGCCILENEGIIHQVIRTGLCPEALLFVGIRVILRHHHSLRHSAPADRGPQLLPSHSQFPGAHVPKHQTPIPLRAELVPSGRSRQLRSNPPVRIPGIAQLLTRLPSPHSNEFLVRFIGLHCGENESANVLGTG